MTVLPLLCFPLGGFFLCVWKGIHLSLCMGEWSGWMVVVVAVFFCIDHVRRQCVSMLSVVYLLSFYLHSQSSFWSFFPLAFEVFLRCWSGVKSVRRGFVVCTIYDEKARRYSMATCKRLISVNGDVSTVTRRSKVYSDP